MKKTLSNFIITCFILINTCLIAVAVNVTDAENFEIPEYTISLPEFFQKQEQDPEQEEKWLEIEWNQWRADVQNKILNSKYMSKQLLKDNSYAYNFKVDNKRKMSEIVVYFIPNSTLEVRAGRKDVGLFKADAPFYAYCIDNNSFYKLKIFPDTLFLDGGEFSKLVKKARISLVAEKYVPRAQYLKLSAENLRLMSNDSILTYPQGSQRKEVYVSTALFSTNNGSWKGFTASDYNDTERVKQ